MMDLCHLFAVAVVLCHTYIFYVPELEQQKKKYIYGPESQFRWMRMASHSQLQPHLTALHLGIWKSMNLEI